MEIGIELLKNHNLMKQLNYKIKKGYMSYLWRGDGKRLYKALYKPKWYNTHYKPDFTVAYRRIDTKIYENVNFNDYVRSLKK